MTYDVFNPVDGQAVFVTRFKALARFVAWMRGLDYAASTEGWL